MAENIATVVDWFGPYTRSEAPKHAGEWGLRGLYAAVGHKLVGTRGPRKLLYVGISENVAARLASSHHKHNEIEHAKIWLGEVSVPGIPGKRTQKTNPHFASAEWALVYFLKPPLNTKKTVGAPNSSCVLLNRWWDYNSATGEYTSKDRPSAGWADIVEYDAFRRTANLIWLGRKAKVKQIDF
ncbi:hypothetical protein [Roseomonas harenae]|uniref:hypothetical protein n=1 Tax=Muricoccus harenae TaxID=2692566 RepID=UPI001331B3C1|nr:hypothetical protein [Roseomonas harenae]